MNRFLGCERDGSTLKVFNGRPRPSNNVNHRMGFTEHTVANELTKLELGLSSAHF